MIRGQKIQISFLVQIENIPLRFKKMNTLTVLQVLYQWSEDSLSACQINCMLQSVNQGLTFHSFTGECVEPCRIEYFI